MARPTKYKPEFVSVARKMAEMGATTPEIGEALGVNKTTVQRWAAQHEEFCTALKVGKDLADDRVERSLYEKAVGYTFDAVKIFMPAGADAPVYAPYVEHVPPSDTAAWMWLKNRRPNEWRERRELSGPDGGPIEVKTTGARDELARLLSTTAATGDADTDKAP